MSMTEIADSLLVEMIIFPSQIKIFTGNTIMNITRYENVFLASTEKNIVDQGPSLQQNTTVLHL